jgi:glycine cleavage system regulatory protein
MKDLTLTLIGPDKTGIVATLAQIVATRNGNWLDSRMIRLGGIFSGIVRVALPETEADALADEVAHFLEKNGFRHSLLSTAPGSEPVPGRHVGLSLSGQDHPGIVHGIFSVFKALRINVEELSTGLQAAPWSGTPVFEAKARLFVPDEVSMDKLQAALEAIANDLLVEVGVSGE